MCFIRTAQWGAVAGFAGGLIYTLVLVATGSLSEIAAIMVGLRRHWAWQCIYVSVFCSA